MSLLLPHESAWPSAPALGSLGPLEPLPAALPHAALPLLRRQRASAEAARKDAKLQYVIISEKWDKKSAKYKASSALWVGGWVAHALKCRKRWSTTSDRGRTDLM